jgi:hypothetical protein
MHSLARLFLTAALACPAWASWPRVLESLGLDPKRLVILEGASAEAQSFGFRASKESVTVRGVTDVFNPKAQIVWGGEVQVNDFETPPQARVYTRDRWTGAPLAAGFQLGEQIIFWTAVPLGEKGYERFPYLPQALAELGARPPAESRSLWAFFDSSYRLRAEPNYLAERWRRGGIAAIHVAAWHYWEPDQQRDTWLANLIDACHRHAILVYAWLELPHVSAAFWEQHPEWRETTATGQDAKLDWRMLMNLANPDCAIAVDAGLRDLIRRQDWDGVNLGELYFESLEGHENPARFTPFNQDVRKAFRAESGYDPRELYDPASKRYYGRDARWMRQYLDYRAQLAARLQKEWLDRLDQIKQQKPWLDLALTHVDDRFDSTIRDKLGADAAELLPQAARHNATFVVEDPATVWHLGPERYEEMARRYARLAPGQAPLAVDVNVAQRYQDVYPTKLQTGTELFQLVHHAAHSFPRVALYFENSIQSVDWPLLAGAAAAATTVQNPGGALEVTALQPVALTWDGCAQVNGQVWPAYSAGKLLLMPGHSIVEPCGARETGPRILDFNGTLHAVQAINGKLKVDYESRSRAIVIFEAPDVRHKMLPPGAHSVLLE